MHPQRCVSPHTEALSAQVPCLNNCNPYLGIAPREPPSRKKANHGNSKATSFYYIKDVNFLAHEPILQKLRQHKTFMKKLSKALGRNEWSRAKGLEENRPVYKLDHIVKER